MVACCAVTLSCSVMSCCESTPWFCVVVLLPTLSASMSLLNVRTSSINIFTWLIAPPLLHLFDVMIGAGPRLLAIGHILMELQAEVLHAVDIRHIRKHGKISIAIAGGCIMPNHQRCQMAPIECHIVHCMAFCQPWQ